MREHGTDPETLDRAKEVVDALEDAGLEPDGVFFERRGPTDIGRAFSVFYEPATDCSCGPNEACDECGGL